MTKRKEFTRGVLRRRSLTLVKKIRLARKTKVISGSLCDSVEKIKLGSNKMNGEIKRIEFNMKYVSSMFPKKKKMSNKKSKAKKVCQSFHTKQFVQPAEL